MALAVSHPLGETGNSGEQEHLLGTEGCFKDLTIGSSDPQLTASNMTVHARWVKNESGGTLSPGVVVQWDSGATYGPGRAVGAVAVADTDIGIGVVDPHISGTVADNAHFWLIEKGPCGFRSTTGTAVAIDDTLAVGAAAGRVIVYAAPGSDTSTGNRDRCGRSLTVVASGAADDTLFRGVADFRF